MCNVPLQKNKYVPSKIKKDDLDYIRENHKIIKELKENLKERILSYNNAEKIIVCGNFSQKYYEEIKEEIKYLDYLYVPHPSRNQWEFIYYNKDSILKLKNIFKDYEKN